MAHQSWPRRVQGEGAVQPFYEQSVSLFVMEPLSWTGPGAGRIITHVMDEELEVYRLLAYLQRVDAHYRDHKLYPVLEELGLRIGQLRTLQERASELEARLGGELVGLDLARMELLRRKPAGPAEWAQVQRSVERALAALVEAHGRGHELRQELGGHVHMAPVGVVPLDVREGWLLLRQRNEALAYAYVLPLVREVPPPDRYRYVRTRYFATWTLSLSTTYEHIKAELARVGPMPNPATFVFESDITLPRIETFLPLAKRITYEVVSAAAGTGA